MAQQQDGFVKILAGFYSNVLDAWTVETMWAEIIDEEKGLYKISSIPFYAPIASDDVVFAEYDENEKILTYRETIEYSGNSLVQVVIMDKTVVTNDIRNIFNLMDCNSEKFKEGYFVFEIPAAKKYKPIRQKLKQLQSKGIIDYAEPVLSKNHQY